MTENLNPTQTDLEVTTPVVEPEGKAQVGDGTEPKTIEPTPKTYSQKEWDDLTKKHGDEAESTKAGHKGTVDKMRGELRTLQLQIEEVESRNFLRQAEDAGIDADSAKQFLTLKRENVETRRKLDEERLDIDQQKAANESELKLAAALKLAKEYELDDASELAKAGTPLEMENVALKLKLAKVKTEQRPTVIPDPTTQSKGGVDLNSMTPGEQIAFGVKLQEARRGNKSK